MANHKSALKRVRANEKKRDLNRYQHKTARNAVRALREETDKKAAEERLPKVTAMIDKLAKKNIIHNNKAANLKSKLTSHINSLGQSRCFEQIKALPLGRAFFVSELYLIMDIAANLKEVKADLGEGIDLVAVSKTKPLSDLQEAYDAGQRIFGENRIQEMAEKAEALPKDIQWHMIGHVQSNKIKYMAPFVSLVHGMDKAKRLKALNKEAEKVDRIIDCLVQIHIAEEDTKFGFDLDEAETLFKEDLEAKYPNIRVCGLMGMATFTEDMDQVRREFKVLKSLFDRIQQEWFPKDYFKILSMGMSGDYQIALEEGSNMVRIGSRIFGARD